MPAAFRLLALAFSCGIHPPDPAAKVEVWDLTLPAAIRTPLDNADTVRVLRLGVTGLGGQAFEIPDDDTSHLSGGVGFGGRPDGPAAAARPVRISRVDADRDPERFRSEVTALVLSAEDQYWSLWQQSTICQACEAAVLRTEQVVERELDRLEAGHGTPEAVAVARDSLERFRHELASATSDRDTAEGRLRDTLGLAHSDDRRIVPATAPRADVVKPDWEQCFVRMFERHPEIVLQKRMVETAQVRRLVARNLCLAAVIGETVPISFGRTPLWLNSRHGQYVLSVQQERLDQVLQERSRLLCGLMADLPQRAHQFQAAVEARAAAARQLEEVGDGRGTSARDLDAVRRWSLSVADEARMSCAYNRTLALLVANQGMLLEAANIVVLDGPKPRRPYARPLEPGPAGDHN